MMEDDTTGWTPEEWEEISARIDPVYLSYKPRYVALFVRWGFKIPADISDKDFLELLRSPDTLRALHDRGLGDMITDFLTERTAIDAEVGKEIVDVILGWMTGS